MEFWNFCNDIIPDRDGKLHRWKYQYPCNWTLFDWQPWGAPGTFQEAKVSSIELAEPDTNDIQALGSLQVTPIPASLGLDVSAVMATLHLSGNKPTVLKAGGCSGNSKGTSTHWVTISYSSHHASGHGFCCQSGMGRGGPPHSMGPHAWSQPPWMGMPYFPQYVPMQALYYSGKYPKPSPQLDVYSHPFWHLSIITLKSTPWLTMILHPPSLLLCQLSLVKVLVRTLGMT